MTGKAAQRIHLTGPAALCWRLAFLTMSLLCFLSTPALAQQDGGDGLQYGLSPADAVTTPYSPTGDAAPGADKKWSFRDLIPNGWNGPNFRWKSNAATQADLYYPQDPSKPQETEQTSFAFSQGLTLQAETTRNSTLSFSLLDLAPATEGGSSCGSLDPGETVNWSGHCRPKESRPVRDSLSRLFDGSPVEKVRLKVRYLFRF